MVTDIVRRVSAVLVALALVFGPAVNGAYASSMGAEMVLGASADTHSSGKCDDCDAAKAGMLAGMCSGAYCNGLAVTAMDAAAFDLPSAGSPPPYNGPHLTGRAAAPDPYPPRPTILN